MLRYPTTLGAVVADIVLFAADSLIQKAAKREGRCRESIDFERMSSRYTASLGEGRAHRGLVATRISRTQKGKRVLCLHAPLKVLFA